MPRVSTFPSRALGGVKKRCMPRPYPKPPPKGPPDHLRFRPQAFTKGTFAAVENPTFKIPGPGAQGTVNGERLVNAALQDLYVFTLMKASIEVCGTDDLEVIADALKWDRYDFFRIVEGSRPASPADYMRWALAVGGPAALPSTDAILDRTRDVIRKYGHRRNLWPFGPPPMPRAKPTSTTP